MPITPRAVLLGAVGIAVLALANPYLAYVRGTWDVGHGSIPSSAVLLLFALVVLNGLLARIAPARTLTRGELVVIYGMLIIPVNLLHTGGIPYIVSCVTYPIYRATPSNDWQHLIWPHIPPWLRLNSPDAVSWFWEGSPEGMGVPWLVWAGPMLAWAAFTVALVAAMFCLGALLSKDWIERQRLTYPLVDVPLAITGNDAHPTLASGLLSNRIFWLGFIVPSLFAVLGFLHTLYPAVPSPQLYDIRLGPYFQGMGLPWSVFSGHLDIRISIIFSVIGISCLLPSEISLSLWLFYLIFRIQQLVWASFGVAEEAGTAAVAINPTVFMGFQEAGGFVALSAVVLYQSRRAFKAAWLNLLGRTRPEPDPYGPLAGSWALIGFVIANGFMFWWAVRAGMSWWTFALLIGLFYTVLVGVSRLVCAGGVMEVDTGQFPRGVITSTVGSLNVGWRSLTMYCYLSTVYMYDPRSVVMPQIMNSFKLLHTGRVRGKAFPLAAVIAVIVCFILGTAALLWVVYRYGASSLPVWPFASYPGWGFGELEGSIHAPELPDNFLRLALAIGAGVTLGLIWLASRFLWWPVSPIGFLIASSYETNRSLWVNVFIAWLVSGLIRRYGGLRLYRTIRPAFLGLVLGEFLTTGALGIVSSIFGIHQPMG